MHLRGTVMVLPGWKNSFFFQDKSFGISVDRDNPEPAVRPGDTVEIDGVTSPGLFAPSVNATRVRITGHHALPPARLVGLQQVRSGLLDSQWIATRGVVRSARIQPQHGVDRLMLSVEVGADTLVAARVYAFSRGDAPLLEGATVRIDAICGSAFNTRRQFIGARLFVNSPADIHIERPAPPDPFAAPVVPLASLLRFSGAVSPSGRVHVLGTVTLVRPGTGFYLQQDQQGVFVQTNEPVQAAEGDSVQVIGYPEAGSYSPMLVNSSVQPAAPQPAIVAPQVAASALLTPMEAYVYASFDSLLIRLQGRLLHIVPGIDEDILLLDCDGIRITAKLPLLHGAHLSSLRDGSTVALTGIETTISDETHEANGSVILLRSAGDIQVLHPGPWWNAERARYLVIALLLLVAVLLAWTLFIRRQTKLHDLIVRDPLTCLYNRRGFLLMAERQWNHAQRHNLQMLLFYIDLDRFKQINDTLGHKAGDTVLQKTATLLKECFRKTDIIGRLGGDEFAITALDSPDLQEHAIRTRLLHAVRSAHAGLPVELGLSIGVLVCNRQLANCCIEDLLARADVLMYQQKRAGRETTSTASPAPLPALLAGPPAASFCSP